MSERLESTLATPSHSRLDKLHACRRAYYYRYVRRLRIRGDATRPLAGKCLHAALDVLYRRGYSAINEAHSTIDSVYGDHTPADKLTFLSPKHLHGILDNYVRRWPEGDDDFQPIKLHRSQIEANAAIVTYAGTYDADGYTVLAEAPMVVRLAPGLTVTVIIDLPVRRANGSVWVVDHKSTCGWLANLIESHVITHQLPTYVLALRAVLGECSGAILNGIYMGEYACNAKSTAQKFARWHDEHFGYTEGQLLETLTWLQRSAALASVEEAVNGDDEQAWLQHPSKQCAQCDYKELCVVGPVLRPGRIAQWYDTSEVT